MSRYIKVEDLQSLLLKNIDKLQALIEQGNKKIEIPAFIGKLINETPTADVKEVTYGKWKCSDGREKFIYNEWKCSICGFTNDIANKILIDKDYHYCPRCGADMRG